MKRIVQIQTYTSQANGGFMINNILALCADGTLFHSSDTDPTWREIPGISDGSGVVKSPLYYVPAIRLTSVPDIPGRVRSAFIDRMELELVHNKDKGDWDSWLPHRIEIMSEILHHVRKLETALMTPNSHGVSEYSADLAVLAMKADELFGEKVQPFAGEPQQ